MLVYQISRSWVQCLHGFEGCSLEADKVFLCSRSISVEKCQQHWEIQIGFLYGDRGFSGGQRSKE